MKILVTLAVFVGLILLVWLGLKIKPRPLAPLNPADAAPSTISLPQGLPAPVERFYGARYESTDIPLIESAVITGRGTMRIAGITLPVRFRFLHKPGQGYRHEIETTFFGLTVLRIDELFLDGTARLELPFGIVEGPNTDQGANLAMWAEAVWMPSVWVTSPEARWRPLDEHSAILEVPSTNGDTTETFVARFDRDTGLLSMLESMRFKAEDDQARTLWINEVLDWSSLDGELQPAQTALTWLDDKGPWAVLTTEQVVYNRELTGELRVPK